MSYNMWLICIGCYLCVGFIVSRIFKFKEPYLYEKSDTILIMLLWGIIVITLPLYFINIPRKWHEKGTFKDTYVIIGVERGRYYEKWTKVFSTRYSTIQKDTDTLRESEKTGVNI